MMKIKKKKSAETNERRRYPAVAVSLCLVFSLICLTFSSGCAAEDSRENLSAQSPAASSEMTGGLKITGSMEISYASEFSVDYLDNGGRLIRISDGSVFLLLPEGTSVPGGLSEEITVLQQPVSRIYLAAAAAMDHFCKIGATDAVALTGKKASDWYIEEARNAVEEGRILYAGKYNMPDYELILQQKCTLAVESTMIFHTPEVKEKLEENGIPVLVDYSSYEEHPLGAASGLSCTVC